MSIDLRRFLDGCTLMQTFGLASLFKNGNPLRGDEGPP
jgi:hypothetical protein